jgi:hypothetical protein
LSVPFRSFVPAAGRRSLLLVAPALLLAGGALSAQDAPFRVGLSASLAQPLTARGEFANGELADLRVGPFEDCLSAGVSLAGTFELGLGANSALRARAEYLSFGGKDSAHNFIYSSYTFAAKLNYGLDAVALGADYLYSLSSNRDGGYIFGGLGYYMTSGSGKMDVSLAGESDSFGLDGSGESLGISLGAGFRFTGNLAAELRFTAMNGLRHRATETFSAGTQPEDIDIDLSWIQVGVCYRF